MKNIAVIFAGGIGSRMKSPDVPKQFLKINDIPIIVHTINNFQNNDYIDDIVVVMLEDYIDYMNTLKEQYNLSKISKIVCGGKTGQESIFNGLKAAREITNGNEAIVLIHDGVRPIIENDLIEKNINSVKKHGSAISSVPSKETIIGISPDSNIDKIIDRSLVWVARAPQSFYLSEILEAHLKAISNKELNVIDSCSLMMNYGKKLHMVETCHENIKITTPEDYYIACGLMNGKKKKEGSKETPLNDSVLESDINEIINSDIVDWSTFKNKKIFITGSTGLIGSLFVKTFLHLNDIHNSNISLVLLVRDKKKSIELFGDRKDITIIESSVESYKPSDMGIDYIIHAASPTKSKFFIEKPVETIDTAVLGTRNMLELAKENKVTSMVYLSSMEMYGTLSSNCVTEKDLGYIDPLNERSSYSEGKRMCELYCYSYMKEYGVPVKIGRISQTFGPGIPKTENRVYKYFADSVINKENIVLKSSGSTIINYSYTTDVILGLLCILQKGQNGNAYNVVGEQTNMTILDSAKWLANEYGDNQVEVKVEIPKENAGFAPDNNMVLNNEKLKKLGWRPKHDIKHGYENLIKFINEQE